ncbi:MAG: hypothetical protein ACJ71W_21740 [Terriglobales bacterium]
MRLPFGKFMNSEIETVPTTYLLYVKGVSLNSYEMCLKELNRRASVELQEFMERKDEMQ